MKQIRAEFGGTVNDIVLAAITRGFRDLLKERRELSDGLIVRSLVPISIRCPDEQGVLSNRLSAVLGNLPVAESDPIRRLQLVSDQMDLIKRTRQAAGAELLTQVLAAVPPAFLNLGTRAAFQIPQPLVQTVTTNVPGPQFPLYILGRKMVQAHPYAPIGDNVKIAIAVFSYLGQLSFGITAESSAAPDLDILVKGIHHGLPELRDDHDHSQRGRGAHGAGLPAPDGFHASAIPHLPLRRPYLSGSHRAAARAVRRRGQSRRPQDRQPGRVGQRQHGTQHCRYAAGGRDLVPRAGARLAEPFPRRP